MIYCNYMEVGLRELKAKLSEYVAHAAAGETVVVTDRGTPVARLTGLGEVSALQRGIEEGWIVPARRTGLSPITRHKASRSTQDVLDEDRG